MSTKPIDIGDLTESVAGAVQRVLASAKPQQALYVRPPRIICGIIFDPSVEVNPLINPENPPDPAVTKIP